MLAFLRRHQRILFFLITIVIVISFSFFGTSSVRSRVQYTDVKVFNSITNRQVMLSELNLMRRFLQSDVQDLRSYGRFAKGVNIFNDDILSKDFLDTGLASALIVHFQEDLKQQLDDRLQSEKHHMPYIHPRLSYLSAEVIWQHLAPAIYKNLIKLKGKAKSVEKEAIDARVALYLAQRQFPQQELKQNIYAEESKLGGVEKDPYLFQRDLSLFGYHSFEDWFGEKTLKLFCQFLINAADLAKKRGYEVSDEETYQALVTNARDLLMGPQEQNRSDEELQASIQRYVENLGMSMQELIRTYKQVLLFRRIFEDLGHAIVEAPFVFDRFEKYAGQQMLIERYEMPKEFQFRRFKELQLFEIYLQAISKNRDPASLDLPKDFRSAQELEKIVPELVNKEYVLELAHVNKDELRSRISLKDTWDWELSDQNNWNEIRKAFPDLAFEQAHTRESRFKILQGLDDEQRFKVDVFAREKIIGAHPNWLQEEMEKAPVERKSYVFRQRGGFFPLKGIINRKDFLDLLDKAPLAGVEAEGEQQIESQKRLQLFSQDDAYYYRISVVERSLPSIARFHEVVKDDLLSPVLKEHLQKHYEKIRQKNPDGYQDEKGRWKKLYEVESSVARDYFATVLNKIEKNLSRYVVEEDIPEAFSGAYFARYRFLDYVSLAREKLQKDMQDSEFTKKVSEEDALDFSDQWKFERIQDALKRSDPNFLAMEDAFQLATKDWSKIYSSKEGKLYFFKVLDKLPGKGHLQESFQRAKDLLSDEVKNILTQEILKEMDTKKAFSL